MLFQLHGDIALHFLRNAERKMAVSCPRNFQSGDALEGLLKRQVPRWWRACKTPSIIVEGFCSVLQVEGGSKPLLFLESFC